MLMATVEVESTLTDPSHQTTVPETLRRALRAPGRLKVIDADLIRRIHSLVRDVEVDLDAPLSADDE